MTASKANDLFQIEWIKTESKRDADDAAGGVDTVVDGDGAQPPIKRQRTSDVGVDVKKEDNVKKEDDDSLDIHFGNLAKAPGDSSSQGTGDAIADFKRMWKDDTDEVSLPVHIHRHSTFTLSTC